MDIQKETSPKFKKVLNVYAKVEKTKKAVSKNKFEKHDFNIEAAVEINKKVQKQKSGQECDTQPSSRSLWCRFGHGLDLHFGRFEKRRRDRGQKQKPNNRGCREGGGGEISIAFKTAGTQDKRAGRPMFKVLGDGKVQGDQAENLYEDAASGNEAYWQKRLAEKRHELREARRQRREAHWAGRRANGVRDRRPSFSETGPGSRNTTTPLFKVLAKAAAETKTYP